MNQVYESEQTAGEPYNPASSKKSADSLSPAEAVQHMRDVARLLQNWRSGLVRPPDTQPS
jgi:hypothetical protein